MWPLEIFEKFIHDFKYALESGEERACGKKIRYATMLLATKAAYNLEAQRPGESLEPYACPYCNHYHVGHSKGERSAGYHFGKHVKLTFK